MAAWGLRHLNLILREGQIYTTSSLVLILFALMPRMVKQYGRRRLTAKERITNYISEQVPGTTQYHLEKAKGCVYMCGVAHYDEDTLGWSRQGNNPNK